MYKMYMLSIYTYVYLKIVVQTYYLLAWVVHPNHYLGLTLFWTRFLRFWTQTDQSYQGISALFCLHNCRLDSYTYIWVQMYYYLLCFIAGIFSIVSIGYKSAQMVDKSPFFPSFWRFFLPCKVNPPSNESITNIVSSIFRPSLWKCEILLIINFS